MFDKSNNNSNLIIIVYRIIIYLLPNINSNITKHIPIFYHIRIFPPSKWMKGGTLNKI